MRKQKTAYFNALRAEILEMTVFDAIGGSFHLRHRTLRCSPSLLSTQSDLFVQRY